MLTTIRKNTFHGIFISASFILSTQLFNYVDWQKTGLQGLLYASFLVFIILTADFLLKKQLSNLMMGKYCLLLSCEVLFSIIAACTIGSSQLNFEIYDGIRVALGFLIYFYLTKFKISEKNILQAITTITIINLFLQLWQLNNTNNILFGLTANGFTGYQRNGILRFFIGSPYSAFVVLFYNWSNLLKKINAKNLILCILSIVSIYLFLTRQYLVAVGATLLLATTFQLRGKTGKKPFIILCISIVAAIVCYENFLSDFVSITQNETYSTDIREKSSVFFFQQSFDNLALFFFGHGHPPILVQWGKTLGFWNSDVGFIGELYCLGFFFILTFFFSVYIILKRIRVAVPLYIQMYVCASILCSPMVFPTHSCPQAMLWGIILYLIDYNLKRNK